MRLSAEEFDGIVKKVIASLPADIRDHLREENIVISVKKRPTREMKALLGLPPGEEVLGFFSGPSRAGQSFFSPFDYPNTIFIFQRPLEEMCTTREELEREIRITVIHEIAHYLGMSEDELKELGYD
ncbi:MAG TPA: metallopeptidase family protein [Syntrophales bacterium]|nr:metallopeptidase family protein [Syntrophales bacterium]HOL59575.1 metallopeptidase family protein [Syntrophales bacterium]HPO35665.1 metallopeptidase family protein [Syntrophales bacterium]